MRTVGPVDREYVLFNKKYNFQNDMFFFSNIVCGVKHPQGAMSDYCSYSVLNIKSFVFTSNLF